MRPVHESPEVVPFIQSAKRDTVAHPDRNPGRNVEIVGNQDGLRTRQLHDETLVG